MTSSPTPAALPDARAREIAAQFGFHAPSMAMRKMIEHLMATPPASDSAVPAGEDDDEELIFKRDIAAKVKAHFAAAAPKVASDTGAGLLWRACKAFDPVLFGDDELEAHRAASPIAAEVARNRVADKLRAVIAALAADATDKPGFGPDSIEYCVHCGDVLPDHFGSCPTRFHQQNATDATDGATGGGEVQRQAAQEASRLRAIPMTEWVWSDALRIFGVLDAIATTPGENLLEQAARTERSLSWVIAEAKRTLRLVQGCMECNADDERRWSETIEWLERLA